MAAPLKVAVAGCGGIAKGMHLPAWKELEKEGRIEMAAVCDVVEERALECASEFGSAQAFTDFEKMLQEAAPDILDICTQNRLHAPMTLAGLQAGAHVLVEKPMAMNGAEARRMLATAQECGRTLMVAQHMRFDPVNELLKGVVDRGELGRVYTGRAQWLRRRGIPGWGRFHIKSESLGGPLIDIGVHMLDLTLWLLGFPKVVSVSGKVYRMFGDRVDLYNGSWGRAYEPSSFDVEDYATALIRFENDLTLNVDVSWAANIAAETMGIQLLGDRGGLNNNPPSVFGSVAGALTTTRFEEIAPSRAHREEIRHFTYCIETGAPVRVQPSESVALQEILDAIYLSSETNSEVKLSEQPFTPTVARVG